ncbi:MAG: hemerythrin domain-containing protein [Nitrospirae bacterium]|nr:hemerythrin domain-containing protein [Nitrospirota bacterium]
MANHGNTINARATFITLMLREDHQKVKQLFDQFKESANTNEKRDIITAAIAALEVHATLEEELIYPAWKEQAGERSLTDEALAEHHVIHVLIGELKNMGFEDERYNAKFTVLSEQVTLHIEEEEGKMFRQAEQADLDWDRLTKHVIERRQSLEQKTLWLLGVPVIVSERETVSATRRVLSYRPGG